MTIATDTCHFGTDLYSSFINGGDNAPSFFVAAQQFGGGRFSGHGHTGGRRGPSRQQEKGDDYYRLLGVKRDADDETIRKKFKKLALKYHPDRNKDEPEEARKKF